MFHAPVGIVYGEGLAETSVAGHGDTVAVAYQDPNGPEPHIVLALSVTAGRAFPDRLEVSGNGLLHRCPSSSSTGIGSPSGGLPSRACPEAPSPARRPSWVSGSCDWVSCDDYTGPPSSTGPPPPPSVGAHALDMKVLVADDDDAMRLLIEAVLATAGHEVVSAPDGDAAWAAFERERPPLMLLDWHMPKCSGIELCERVREGPAARATFIIMITARGATDDLQRLLDAGADDYLSKPFSPEALMTRLVIAERRLTADRARREAEEALARAQWLAGIGETALALQHEINNPLAALLGNAALLTAGLAAPDEQGCADHGHCGAGDAHWRGGQATRGTARAALGALRRRLEMLDLSGDAATGADAPRRK